MDFASEVGSKLAAQPASENFGSPVFEVGCSTLMSGQDNGSAEKPVDSLSKWLDGDQSPEMGSPGVQSSLREDAVDFCPYRKRSFHLRRIWYFFVNFCAPKEFLRAVNYLY